LAGEKPKFRGFLGSNVLKKSTLFVFCFKGGGGGVNRLITVYGVVSFFKM